MQSTVSAPDRRFEHDVRIDRIVLILSAVVFVSLTAHSTLSLSFNEYEVRHIAVSEWSLREILAHFAEGTVRRPPLFYLVQHAWLRVFGQMEVSLRSLSLILSVGTLPFLMGAARLAHGPVVARAVVLLFALSPFVLHWGWMACGYPLIMFLYATAHYFLFKTEQDRNFSPFYSLVMMAALYTNYYALLLLPCHGAYAIASRRSPRRIVFWGALLPILAFLPWIPTLFVDLRSPMESLTLTTLLGPLKSAAYTLYAFALGETLLPSHFLVTGAFAVGVGIIIPVSFRSFSPPLAVLWGGQWLLLFTVGISTATLQPYRAYPFAIGLFIAMSVGLVRLLHSSRLRLMTVLALVSPAWLMSDFNFVSGKEFLKIGMLEPWRQIHHSLLNETDKHDLIIYRSFALHHYLVREPIRASTIYLGDPPDNIPDNTRRVFVYQLNSPYEWPTAGAYSATFDRLHECCTLVRRSVLVADPWSNIKKSWLPGAGLLGISIDRLVLYEFVRNPPFSDP